MSTPDAQEDSPITQGEQTAQFLQEQGLTATWTRTYFDLGISAKTVRKRRGIIALLNDAEKLRPAYIVFYRLDRAFRNGGEQAVALQRLKRLGIKVLKVRDPNIDGHVGDLIDGIMGHVNEFERALTGDRVRDHNEVLAREGYWAGGRAPYGYRYHPSIREIRGRKRTTIKQGWLEPDPVEWPICRQIWDWALQGYRKMEIVRLANDAGYRRRNGGLWTRDAVTAILTSRIYCGQVPYSSERRTQPRSRVHWDNTNWYPGRHQAMVTMDEWYQVQASLNSGTRHRQPNKNPRAELAGLIRCKLCGAPVVSAGRDPEFGYYYTCQAGGRGDTNHPYWSRSPWVVHMALQAILDHAESMLPETPSPETSDANRQRLERELSSLKNQRRRLKELYIMGEFENDLEAYQRRARELDTRITAVEEQLTRCGPSADTLNQMREQLRHWESAYEAATTVQQRQRIWASLIESVTMDPTSMRVRLRYFDPAVPLDWEIDLPPVKTRRPGTVCGRGIAGQRSKGRSKAYLLSESLRPRPVITAEKP